MPIRKRHGAARAMAEIEKESLDKTGLRSDVVTLYQGGQYHLYQFKKLTDVRLVFALSNKARFLEAIRTISSLRVTIWTSVFFRAYEDGQTAKVEHYLKMSKAGAAENELVLVSGHPGRTSRLFTVAELEYLRDHRLPYAPPTAAQPRGDVQRIQRPKRGERASR